MSQIVKARRDVYSCLSCCFSYPSERLIEVASAGLLSQAWGTLSTAFGVERQHGAMAQFAGLLEAEVGLADGARLLDLQVEYTRLFVGPFRPKVSPYESLSLNREGVSLGSLGRDLMKTFRQEGLTLAPQCQDLPDHIAHELEFMGYLCHQEDRAETHQDGVQYRRRQQTFFRQHLMSWVPILAAEVERATELDFYRSLARATDDFLERDSSQMEASAEAEERRSL